MCEYQQVRRVLGYAGLKAIQHFVLDPGSEKEPLEIIKWASGKQFM